MKIHELIQEVKAIDPDAAEVLSQWEANPPKDCGFHWCVIEVFDNPVQGDNYWAGVCGLLPKYGRGETED